MGGIPSAFGGLLRHWRKQQDLTQLALSMRVGTTTRHLSYLENGRSRPGRDLVLRLGQALDLSLRARNELLTSAGLAREFTAREIRSPALASYRRAIEQLIASLDPYPAFVIDPLFNLEQTNAVGRAMLPGAVPGAQTNLVELFLAPGPARASIANFPEVAWSWHARLARATVGRRDEEVLALRARVETYLSDVPRPLLSAEGAPVICPTFQIGETAVRTIGMTMRFGPSREVTLEEISVDALFPRDDSAERFFLDLARSAST